MLLPFAAGFKQGKSFAVDTETLVNCYIETATNRNAKSVRAIYGRPGLKPFGNWGELPARGVHQFGNRAYAVFQDRLEVIRPDGVSFVAGLLLSESGFVSMDDNGTQLMIVDGSNGYIFPGVELGAITLETPLLLLPLALQTPSVMTSTTVDVPALELTITLAAPAVVAIIEGGELARITDPDFPARPTHVTYLDGFFIVNDEGTDQWYVSSLKDGASWNALDFASAESDPDKLRNVVADHGELWLFGDRSTEVWQNTGQADFTFERLQGAKIQWGVHAPWSVSRYADTLVCLAVDDHGAIQVISFVNYQPVRISNEAIEEAIAGYSLSTDAIAWVMVDRGREFYVLSFPTGKQAFAYDVREKEWHELKTGAGARFVPQHHIYFLNKHLVSDYTAGNLWEQAAGLFDDAGEEIHLKARGYHIHDSERIIGHASLQVVFEAGVGLANGQGSDPQAMLRWSNDGGGTWSNEYWRSIGKIGQRRARAIWRSLGRARDRVYELTVTDPVKRVIVGMELKAS
jgi:hypothetical protein